MTRHTDTTRKTYTTWHGRSHDDRWCHTRTPGTLDLTTGKFDNETALDTARSDADSREPGLLGWVTDDSGKVVYTA